MVKTFLFRQNPLMQEKESPLKKCLIPWPYQQVKEIGMGRSLERLLDVEGGGENG